jgi:hypothetical protein
MAARSTTTDGSQRTFSLSKTSPGRFLDRLRGIRYGVSNTFAHQPGIILGTLKLNIRINAS